MFACECDITRTDGRTEPTDNVAVAIAGGTDVYVTNSQMLSERDAMKRESAVVLASAMADEQLAAALMNIEQLTVKLAQEQRDHQQEVNVGSIASGG